MANLLAPQSGAYYDVWLDGEKFMSMERENPEVTKARAFNQFGTNFENSPEPIYGKQFLPRKFKVAVTVPGDNSVDLLTQDLVSPMLTAHCSRPPLERLCSGGPCGDRIPRSVARLPAPDPVASCRAWW